MEQPGAFFLWLGVCAVVSWRTAFQMPDGFGNAILLCQIGGAIVSSILMAMYLPSAINPNLQVPVGPTGRVRMTTIPRTKAMRGAAIGFVVFLVGNVGGYVLDRGMGLPKRYAEDGISELARWVSHEPALARCLGTTWSPPTTCTLTFVLREPEEPNAHAQELRAKIDHASCGNAALEKCALDTLASGAIRMSLRRRDSFAYAGETRLQITTMLVGTGTPPPVERGP